MRQEGHPLPYHACRASENGFILRIAVLSNEYNVCAGRNNAKQ